MTRAINDSLAEQIAQAVAKELSAGFLEILDHTGVGDTAQVEREAFMDRHYALALATAIVILNDYQITRIVRKPNLQN
jgi:hypothetical protein